MSHKFPRTTEDLVVLEGALYNRLVDELERANKLFVAPPLRLQDVAGGRLLSLAGAPPETLTARLTSTTSTPGQYEWKQVVLNDDGTYTDVPNGRASADFGRAYGGSGASYNVGTSAGDVVTLRRANDPDTGLPLWVIISGAAAGVKLGTLQGSWTPGTNTVTLAPSGGGANITCYIQFPTGRAAPSFAGVVGDVLGYMSIPGGGYVLVGAPVLPNATGAFQGLYNQGGTTSNWQPDHVRAAAV